MNILNQGVNDKKNVNKVDLVSKKIVLSTLALILLAAVQVSTQNAGDWLLLGLNILDMSLFETTPIIEVSHVSLSTHFNSDFTHYLS
ncbi:hypothetical protein HQQ94_07210 [Shewanella sp. VB17]|uniref:hypothetical protein n=1 Tax=Shewanella sp. VB17 TaxID=2739432 RepID=UPI001567167B|nr:hypothetical protein [Shewanella sp. VB17]NRD73031.1 hypothetical protein [Shewanella sp. VB17]